MREEEESVLIIDSLSSTNATSINNDSSEKNSRISRKRELDNNNFGENFRNQVKNVEKTPLYTPSKKHKKSHVVVRSFLCPHDQVIKEVKVVDSSSSDTTTVIDTTTTTTHFKNEKVTELSARQKLEIVQKVDDFLSRSPLPIVFKKSNGNFAIIGCQSTQKNPRCHKEIKYLFKDQIDLDYKKYYNLFKNFHVLYMTWSSIETYLKVLSYILETCFTLNVILSHARESFKLILITCRTDDVDFVFLLLYL